MMSSTTKTAQERCIRFIYKLLAASPAAYGALWAASRWGVWFVVVKEFLEIYTLHNFSWHWFSYSKYFIQTLKFFKTYSPTKKILTKFSTPLWNFLQQFSYLKSYIPIFQLWIIILQILIFRINHFWYQFSDLNFVLHQIFSH